jgi:hypothetical protein
VRRTTAHFKDEGCVRAPRQFRIAVVWASIVIVGIAAGGHNKLKERRRALMRIAISTWRFDPESELRIDLVREDQAPRRASELDFRA